MGIYRKTKKKEVYENILKYIDIYIYIYIFFCFEQFTKGRTTLKHIDHLLKNIESYRKYGNTQTIYRNIYKYNTGLGVNKRSFRGPGGFGGGLDLRCWT